MLRLCYDKILGGNDEETKLGNSGDRLDRPRDGGGAHGCKRRDLRGMQRASGGGAAVCGRVQCAESIRQSGHSRQLEECAALAEEKGLVICDGTTLLHMPLYKKLRQIIEEGAIGDVKMVQVNFGSCKEYDVNNRFFSKELAGGALLDIGVYAVSFARYFMKSRPDVILTTANYFETGVDETSGIILKNPDGEMAVIALTMRAKQPKRGVVAGEKGFIEISDYPRAQRAVITYTEDGRTEVIEVGSTDAALQYEVRDMQEYILNKSGQENLRIVRDVMDVLTAVRDQWGLVYPFE